MESLLKSKSRSAKILALSLEKSKSPNVINTPGVSGEIAGSSGSSITIPIMMATTHKAQTDVLFEDSNGEDICSSGSEYLPTAAEEREFIAETEDSEDASVTKIDETLPGGSSMKSSNQLENREQLPCGRKRTRNESNWKRNSKKRLRNHGESYVSCYTKKNVPAKQIKRVDCKCHYGCISHISDDDQRKINAAYYSLGSDITAKRSFIARHVKRVTKNRGLEQSRQKYTIIYTLTVRGEKLQVCREYFKSTLAISEKTIRTALDKVTEEGAIIEDHRGKNTPTNKKPDCAKQIIRDHIKSLPVVCSHYCRSTTKRKYLPAGLSETRLYNDYLAYCHDQDVMPEKKGYYTNIFRKEFNLGFHRPKKDQCAYCTWYNHLNVEDKQVETVEFESHMRRKEQARTHKQMDKDRTMVDDTFNAFAFDMEKVLCTPSTGVGKLYYKRKLNTYNFTVYNLGNKEAVNFMWHEGVGGKGSSEVASCLHDTLTTCDGNKVSEVTLYSDTAGGQNRNSTISAACLHVLSSSSSLELIAKIHGVGSL